MLRVPALIRSTPYTKRSLALRTRFRAKEMTAGTQSGQGRDQSRATKTYVVSDGFRTRFAQEAD